MLKKKKPFKITTNGADLTFQEMKKTYVLKELIKRGHRKLKELKGNGSTHVLEIGRINAVKIAILPKQSGFCAVLIKSPSISTQNQETNNPKMYTKLWRPRITKSNHRKRDKRQTRQESTALQTSDNKQHSTVPCLPHNKQRLKHTPTVSPPPTQERTITSGKSHTPLGPVVLGKWTVTRESTKSRTHAVPPCKINSKWLKGVA